MPLYSQRESIRNLPLSLLLCSLLCTYDQAQAEDAAPAKLTFASAEPLTKVTNYFQQQSGWIGGDGVYAVATDEQHTVWIFSDTFVGTIRDGKRTDAKMVNNTVGVQDRTQTENPVQFFIARNERQEPQAIFIPNDGKGWFWPQAGAMSSGRLIVFLSQVEKKGDGALGFRQVGRSLGIVSNPLDAPTRWKIEQKKLTDQIFTPERERALGAAVLTSEDWLYLYGTDETRRSEKKSRSLIVARVKLADAADQTQWRYFHAGDWVADANQADLQGNDLATEFSVSYLPKFQQYLLVYTENGLSDKVLARTSDHPWGPWSRPTMIYQCPEMGWDKKIFCYSAKAQPTLSQENELVFSYVANSFDFWQVFRDARLYWPRFVRVPLSAH